MTGWCEEERESDFARFLGNRVHFVMSGDISFSYERVMAIPLAFL